MKTKLFLAILPVVIAVAFLPANVQADGIIVPDLPICDPWPCPPPPCPGPRPCPPMPPIVQLVIRYHHVNVRIEDQVAVTHVDQVFYNPNDWQVEGTYIFPIPSDAAVTSFTLWVDGSPVEGEILDAEEARRTYEEITKNLRDPALLEYADRGAVKARVFPIPPQGERRVELEYTQVLAAENGLVRYVYPLNTEKFSLWPLEEVSISVDIRSSSAPLRAIYSPSHSVDVSRENDYHVIAGYEESNVRPDSDFSLYYSVGYMEAFHLITYREPDKNDPDGFFLLLLAPKPESSERIVPKDVMLVLDRSGSMEGEKFQQAREALRYILNHLNPEDRFNIVAFSTGLESYGQDMRPASEANEAIRWIDGLSPQGSTDINRALLEATEIVGRERPTYLIFLTDGLPTEGEVDSQKILDNLASTAADNLRLFSFGVGYDVDTFLLDSLAQAHHGTSTYVLPEERLDETISAFFEKISTPVLTDLKLDFGDIGAYDIYPDPLPDLFMGTQIVVVCRYRYPGTSDVSLTGRVNGDVERFNFREQLFPERRVGASDTLQALPRLWATRKIGYLLNQIRLNGPDQETIEQIVRLSIRYGIVTPYTSYLVTEEAPLGASAQERIAGEEFDQMLVLPSAPTHGRAAVEEAAEQGVLKEAEAPASLNGESEDVIRIVGSKAFVFTDGIWIDTAFDPENMETVKVGFLSDDYFELASIDPNLAAGFALGSRVIALSDGIAYQVVEEESVSEPLVLPATHTPRSIEQTETVINGDDGIITVSTPVANETNSIPSTQSAGSTWPCAAGFVPLLVIPLIGVAGMRKSGL